MAQKGSYVKQNTEIKSLLNYTSKAGGVIKICQINAVPSIHPWLPFPPSKPLHIQVHCHSTTSEFLITFL